MKTVIRRGLRSAFAGSLLLGATVATSVFVGSLPASGSPTYTPAVTDTIPVTGHPEAVAVDPDTGTVYVANSGNPGTVSVISEATDTVTNSVTVGASPYGVAVDPNTGTVYVANYNSNTVSVISAATDTVTNTIAVGKAPSGVAVDPNTGRVYVTNQGNDTVSVISAATDTVTKTITSVGTNPLGVAVDPSTGTVYVAGFQSDNVSVISEATDTVTKTIAVGSLPLEVAVDPKTGTVYVTNDDGNSVSVISEATDTVTNTIAVGVSPPGVAVDPNTGRVYVTSTTGTVSVISEATGTVTNTLAVGRGPTGVAVDPDTDTVYVANSSSGSSSGTVSVISEVILDDYSYAAGGGTGTAPASGSGLDGTTITLAANTFTRPGYTFAGWNDETNTYAAGATYTLSSDGTPIVFTAQWTKAPMDTVAFDSDGGAAVAPLSGTDGSSITLPSDTYPSFAPFEGWFTASSGGTEVGAAGSSYTIPVGGITLYAQWTARRPSLIAVSPNVGPTKSGTGITITGSGFVSGTTVVIGQGNGTTGAIAATHVVVHSATKITAVTGGGAKAGVFNLFVTTARGTSAANYAGDEFNYDALPMVTGVSPKVGPVTGGTPITITGTGFVAGANVVIGQGRGAFEGVPATGVMVVSPTEIMAVTSQGTEAGSWSLFVTTPGGTSAATSGSGFTYLAVE